MNLRHNQAKKEQKNAIQNLKLIGFGFDSGPKPFEGELDVFDLEDLISLGFSREKAKNIVTNIKKGRMSVTATKPKNENNYLSLAQVPRNNLVRLFLEDDSKSTLSLGCNFNYRLKI